MREAFRALRGRFRPGFDVVVIVRRFREGTVLSHVLEEWVRAEPALNREMDRSREDSSRASARNREDSDHEAEPA